MLKDGEEIKNITDEEIDKFMDKIVDLFVKNFVEDRKIILAKKDNYKFYTSLLRTGGPLTLLVEILNTEVVYVIAKPSIQFNTITYFGLNLLPKLYSETKEKTIERFRKYNLEIESLDDLHQYYKIQRFNEIKDFFEE